MALSSDACLFATLNRLDGGAVSAIGSEVAQLPASNLMQRRLSRAWRTAGMTSPSLSGRDTTSGRTWVELDMGAGYSCQIVALVGHNLLTTAKWRVRLSNSSTFASTVADSGQINVWPTLAGYGGLPWGVFAWGDSLTSAERGDYASLAIYLMDAAVSARYLRIDLFDSGNTDGFLQVGRAWCGPIYQPSLNMDLDWTIGFEDPSEISRGLGGELNVDERPRYRVATCTLGHIPEDEAMFYLFDYMDRRKGISGDMIFIPQPNKPDLYIHEAIYGRQRTLDPLRNPYVDLRRAKGLQVEELI